MTYEQYRKLVIDEVAHAGKVSLEEAERLTGDVSDDFAEGYAASDVAAGILYEAEG